MGGREKRTHREKLKETRRGQSESTRGGGERIRVTREKRVGIRKERLGVVVVGGAGVTGDSRRASVARAKSVEWQESFSGSVADLLDELFSAFDAAVEEAGMYKYQHVGDWCNPPTSPVS